MAFSSGKVLEGLLLSIIGSVFLYQVALNFQTYLAGNTVFSLRSLATPITPPVILCPRHGLDPMKLLDFGLRVNSTHFKQAKADFASYAGIPNNVTLLQLVEKASWNIGEMVKEIHFGNLQEVYLENTTTSLRWRRVYLGVPCYSLDSLMLTNTTELSIHVRSTLTDVTERFCADNNWQTNMTQLCAAAHLRSEVFYIHVFVPAVSNGYMTRFSVAPMIMPLEDLHLASYSVQQLWWQGTNDPEACLKSCYVQIAKLDGTCLAVQPEKHETLPKDCDGNAIFSDKEGCASRCKSGHFENKWRILSKGDHRGRIYKIRLVPEHKLLTEFEVYPSSKLLADIGGSLGFFVGVSLLTFNSVTQKILTQYKVHHDAQRLLAFSTYILLIFAALVHILTVVYQMMDSSPKTYVSLERKENIVGNETQKNLDSRFESKVKKLLSVRFASRSFGCDISTSEHEFFQCLFTKDATNVLGILPFMYVEDLPKCDTITPDFPYIKFQVPHQTLEGSLNLKRIDKCYKKHINETNVLENGVQFRDGTYKIMVFEESASFISLFVEFGGIVSLYFGFSLLGVLNNRYLMESFRKYMSIFRIVIQVSLCLCTLYMCLIQVSNFLFRHPVSVVPLSVQETTNNTPISMTACPWPPLNISSIVVTMNALLKPEEVVNRSSFISDEELIIEKLVAIFSGNLTLYHEVWQQAQWTLVNVVYKYKKGDSYISPLESKNEWKSSYIRGHKCFTYTPSPEHQELYLIFMQSEINFYFTVHASDEIPYIWEVHKTNNHVYVEKVSKFVKSSSEGNFANCMDLCLKEHAAIGHPISICKYGSNCPLLRSILEWAFRSAPYNKTVFPTFYDSDIDDLCLAACQKSTKSFLRVMTKSRSGAGLTKTTPSFTLRRRYSGRILVVYPSMNMHSQEIVKEYDGYSLSQLVSEAGSVIGIVLGTSVLSLLLKVLRFLKTLRPPRLSSQ